jgi:hypothetical protein
VLAASPAAAAGKLPRNAFPTVLNADAIEFSPDKGLESIFVCGTYQLKEGDEGLKVLLCSESMCVFVEHDSRHSATASAVADSRTSDTFFVCAG